MSGLMNSPQILGAYRANAVRGASPGNLVVMLYDGAIRFMANAIRAFDYEDPLDFNLNVHTNITKTQAIIRELYHALDLNDDNELGHNLANLYNYFDHRLQEANITKDRAIIEEVLERVSELRDAWEESLKNPANQTPSNPENSATAPAQAPPSQRPDTSGFSIMG